MVRIAASETEDSGSIPDPLEVLKNISKFSFWWIIF